MSRSELTKGVQVVYRGSDEDVKPVVCACDEIGHPNKCWCEADGYHEQYSNTHFRTEREAWESIRKSADACVSLAGSQVLQAREKLLKAQEWAADAAARFREVQDGYRRFERLSTLSTAREEQPQ